MSDSLKEMTAFIGIILVVCLLIFVTGRCQRETRNSQAKCFQETHAQECWK